MKSLFSTSLAAITALLAGIVVADVIVVPDVPANAPSKVQFVSTPNSFTAPHVKPINSTTYDWWYFDFIGAGTAPDIYSLVIVFYTSTGTGFDALEPFNQAGFTSVDLIQYTLTWPNGTSFETLLNGTSATFATNGDGVTGKYAGTGSEFTIAPDLSAATITINAPESGVVGTVQMHSIAPPHYPCGPNQAGANLEFLPHVGWSNAIPDASMHADFTVDGEKVSFSGRGYADKNWGDTTFSPTVSSWYFGHTRLGPYSIVWFDALDAAGKEHTSAYVAKDGKIVTAKCGGLKVRPFGANATYPPLFTTGPPSGFHVEIEAGADTITFDVEAQEVIEEYAEYPTPYYRWLGTATGGCGWQKNLTGSALFEEFKFAMPS